MMKLLVQQYIKVSTLLLASLFMHVTNATQIGSIWSVLGNSETIVLKSGAIRYQPVAVALDHSVINKLDLGTSLLVPLYEDTAKLSVIDERQHGNLLIWRAVVNGDQQGTKALLFISDSRVSAWIPTTHGIYRMEDGLLFKEYKSGGEAPDFRVPTDVTLPTPTILDGAEVKNTVQKKAIASQQSTSPSVEGTLEFRVFFVVTPEFVSAFPDTSQKITEYLTVANEAYKASGIELEMVNAGIITADIENFTAAQILDNLGLVDSDTPFPDGLAVSIRQQAFEAKADNIEVLPYKLTSEDGLCGLANQNGNANKYFNYSFSIGVTGANTTFEQGTIIQPCGILDFTHEVGHTMGLGHSLKQGSVGTVYPYARGFGVDEKFTTIMAYPQAFETDVQISKFSSPNLTCFEDLKCGIDGSQDDGADAVLAVNNIKAQFAYIHNEATALNGTDTLNLFSSDIKSCISESYPNLISNGQIRNIDCADLEATNFQSFSNLPNLSYLALGATDGDLSPFKSLKYITVADFRGTEISNVRRIAHIKGQLDFLQFSASKLTCQEIKVIESWSVGQLSVLGSCLDLDSDNEDFDGDGTTNLVDTDDDNDGIDDISDAKPFDSSNANDIDADGVSDSEDAFPFDESESVDTDGDTIGNNQDNDDDNDGVEDANDCAPLDNTKSSGCSNNTETKFTLYDYDGDGKADIGVRRASTQFQYVLNSGDGEIQRVQFGRDTNDITVSGDFDGDRKADIAVRRASNQLWYIQNSSNSEIQRVNFGKQTEDIPVPADYDGDGITDIAVRRPSTFFWYVLNSSDGEIQRIQFGKDADDIPVPADYDGDGKADVAVRRASTQFWYIKNSSDDEIQRINFGKQVEDIPVPADYDGDGKADVAVRRPSTQYWYIKNSSNGEIQRVIFGRQAEDIPIPADYDGDGKADIAVRRPSTQFQYILRSSDGEIERIQFGRNSTDMPLAAPVMNRFNGSTGISENSAHPDINEAEYVERTIISKRQAEQENIL